MQTGLIPKKIHYCWFGGKPLPELAQKCIASWEKYCPDYEIVRWDESNFDMTCCGYVKEAYAAGKWAFVSDVARLYALVEQGGIYMDTDVELVKPLDNFLDCQAFSGFETDSTVMTGLLGSVAHQALFTQLLREYDGIHFLDDQGAPDLTTNVVRMTQVCMLHGMKPDNTLQTVCGMVLYPKDYFCPMDSVFRQMCMTENTHAIHHFDASWQDPEQQWFSHCRSKLGKVLPMKFSGYIASALAAVKFRGLSGLLNRVKGFVRKRTRRGGDAGK